MDQTSNNNNLYWANIKVMLAGEEIKNIKPFYYNQETKEIPKKQIEALQKALNEASRKPFVILPHAEMNFISVEPSKTIDGDQFLNFDDPQ